MTIHRWCAAVLAAALLFPAAASAAPRRPNVILIVADDLGYGDLGVYGGRIAKTPHIDALAARGVRLTDGHVAAPVCSPSRVALLSGRYQERFGYEFNPTGKGVTPLPTDQKTIADRLKALGYTTGLIGKWHLGWTPALRPDRRGFDSYYGMASGNRHFPPDFPGVERHPVYNQVEGEAARGRFRVTRDGQDVEIRKNITEAFTDEALAFIDRNQAKPFFLYLAYNAPHTPLEADAEHLARFPASLPLEQRVLAAMVATLDDGVGRITARLKAAGLERDTLVIFISDNGCPLYLGGSCSNDGLRGGKRHLLEGGLRVPFLVSRPGVLKPGVYRGLASTLDIAPTVLAQAGGAGAPELEGVDLFPYLRGAKGGDPHAVLFWRSSPSAAVRAGPWKLIRAQHPDDPGMETFLFRLDASGAETADVSAQNPDVVARLSAQLDGWEKTLPAPSFQGRRETIEIEGRKVVQTF